MPPKNSAGGVNVGRDLEVEGCPTDGQKERLRDFLTELKLLTRRYKILLVDQDETVQLLDLSARGHLIGVGIVAFTVPGDDARIIDYEASDSILDGTWLVDTADGPVEQHTVMNVFPSRCS